MLDNDGPPLQVTDKDLKGVLGADLWGELCTDGTETSEDLRTAVMLKGRFVCDTLDRTAPPHLSYVAVSPVDSTTGFQYMVDQTSPVDYDDDGEPFTPNSDDSTLEVRIMYQGYAIAGVAYHRDHLRFHGASEVFRDAPLFDIGDTSLDMFTMAESLRKFAEANTDEEQADAARDAVISGLQVLAADSTVFERYETGAFDIGDVEFEYSSTYDADAIDAQPALEEALTIKNHQLKVGFQLHAGEDDCLELVAYSLDEDGAFAWPPRTGDALTQLDFQQLDSSISGLARKLAEEYDEPTA